MIPDRFENEADLYGWIADCQHELELRAYEGADFDYVEPFEDPYPPEPRPPWSPFWDKYERRLRVERKRLAQSEDSYCMRATAAVVASQRRRRHR